MRVHRTLGTPPRSAAGQCLGEESVVTDAEGRFAFPEVRDFLWFFVYGDRLDTWQLCFQPEGEDAAVYEASGWWGGPPAQALICALEDPGQACVESPESPSTP
ncbi:MAG: hypothetical protein P1V51_05795 [Deltaproteobacteria bacterium]|nr:hypothetical protein [Deltaproteobacteria bacterium]